MYRNKNSHVSYVINMLIIFLLSKKKKKPANITCPPVNQNMGFNRKSVKILEEWSVPVLGFGQSSL